jgi:WD40 repeat protein
MRPTTLVNNNSINRVLAISPTGNWLACGTGNSDIQLFNLNSESSNPRILKGHTGWVWSLSFTPGGNKLVSTSSDKTILVWDLNSFTSTKIVDNDQRIRVIAVSPNGEKIAGGADDGKIITWNMDGSNRQIFFNGSGNTVYALTYNSNGRYLAAGDKTGRLRIFNASSGGLVYNLSGHRARILDVNFSPDNQFMASSSMDGTVRIWDMDNLNQSPVVLTGHESWVLAVAFSPDSKHLITSSQKGDLILAWPTEPDVMANEMCSVLSRNLTESEWNAYVAPDIPYQQTCKK